MHVLIENVYDVRSDDRPDGSGKLDALARLEFQLLGHLHLLLTVIFFV